MISKKDRLEILNQKSQESKDAVKLEQKYKVNFSKYHRLCKDRSIMPFALQACGMCGS